MRQREQESRKPAANERDSYRIDRRAMLRTAGAGALAAGSMSLSPVRASLGQEATPASANGETPILAGGMSIFPRHGTMTASPHTEISFRGVTEDELGELTVLGSVSGGHSGLFMPHSDGNGVSFVPDAQFEPGEEVTIRAEVELGQADDGALVFGVARPAEMPASPTSKTRDEPEEAPLTLRSRPDLLPPVFDITVPAEGTAEGYVFLGSRVENGQAGAVILDNSGEPIWFAPPASDLDERHDVRVQEYQGEPVLTYVEANGPRGYRLGHYVILDSSYQRIAAFQIGNGLPGGDHHECLLTPRGSALIGCYSSVLWDLSSVGGSREGIVIDYVVQEIEIETGRVLFEWHSLDHIALDESNEPVPAPDEGGRFDYVHGNSIDEDENGDLVISARHADAIYKIDRATGEVAWRLNGNRSDFEMDEGTPFAYQHDARFQPNGQLSLFDNTTDGSSRGVPSRGLVLELDTDAMTATLVREYVHPEEVVSSSQANTQLLPNGNVFVGWGSEPIFSEFDPDGNLIFDGRFPAGGSSYRAYRFPWTGQPSAPPDVAVQNGTVYVSWNGATDVASWRVLGGATPDDLAEVGSGERTGFETEIPLDTDVTHVAAEALDAGGAVLGTSEAIEVVI